jgi:hypothetical protein
MFIKLWFRKNIITKIILISVDLENAFKISTIYNKLITFKSYRFVKKLFSLIVIFK